MVLKHLGWWLTVAVIVILIASGARVLAMRTVGSGATMRIRGITIEIEVADDAGKQARGLSGRARLCDRCGMLFTYSTPAIRSFWMSDMRFPLDFVWIRDGRIIDVTPNVPHPEANSEPVTVESAAPADMVLEVPAGTIVRYGWSLGDRVTIRR